MSPRRIVEQSLELYTCSAGAADSEAPDLARNGTQPHAYNELATLMSVTGVRAYTGSPHVLCTLRTASSRMSPVCAGNCAVVLSRQFMRLFATRLKRSVTDCTVVRTPPSCLAGVACPAAICSSQGALVRASCQ